MTEMFLFESHAENEAVRLNPDLFYFLEKLNIQ